MTSFLTSFVITFGVILVVELPDKTLVATLVLSTRYRPRPVLVGVIAAFAVQCVIAVTAGGLLHLLPRRGVEIVVAALFALGSVLLIRESFAGDEPPEYAAARLQAPFRTVVLASFGVLFAAEWGDASQIATAGLAAHQGQPVAVFLGAWLALSTVAGIAVIAGKAIVRKVPVHVVHRVAGILFGIFAIITIVNVIR